jgi:hypothetical protein
MPHLFRTKRDSRGSDRSSGKGKLPAVRGSRLRERSAAEPDRRGSGAAISAREAEAEFAASLVAQPRRGGRSRSKPRHKYASSDESESENEVPPPHECDGDAVLHDKDDILADGSDLDSENDAAGGGGDDDDDENGEDEDLVMVTGMAIAHAGNAGTPPSSPPRSPSQTILQTSPTSPNLDQTSSPEKKKSHQ